MSHEQTHIRWRAYEFCPGCGCYQSFAPGRVNDDGSVETRTCPEDGCGTQIDTDAFVHTPLSEATVFDLY